MKTYSVSIHFDHVEATSEEAAAKVALLMASQSKELPVMVTQAGQLSKWLNVATPWRTR